MLAPPRRIGRGRITVDSQKLVSILKPKRMKSHTIPGSVNVYNEISITITPGRQPENIGKAARKRI